MIRTIVFGAGRMARTVQGLASEYPDIEIVARVSRRRPENRVRDHSAPFFNNLEDAGQALDPPADLLLDFTLPEGTLAAARWCADRRVAMLSGVTGIDDETHAALDEAASVAPVLWAANLSFGINMLAGLLHDLGRVVGEETAVTIEEIHHAGKKDAPSGTALFLARHLRPPADGAAGTDPCRISSDFPSIEFVSRREGQVVGDHSVSILMPDEIVTLSHHAKDRRLFARGALDAGQWLASQSPGRYSAADWIRSVAAPNGQA